MIDTNGERPSMRGPVLRAVGAFAVTVGLVAALSGCAQGADESGSPQASEGTSDITTLQPLTTDFEVDQELHDALPESIKASGVLKVATLGTNAPIVFKTDAGEMNGAVRRSTATPQRS